jgi:hypothetical protein
MNTNDLARLYDRLTPRERLPLIVAASVRGDAVERARLTASAPSMGLAVPHHYTLARALSEAAHMQMVTLLNVAANFWQWWGLWGWHGRAPGKIGPHRRRAGKRKGAAADAEEVRLDSMGRYPAFLFVVHFDGWKQFCSELTVDPDALLEIMPGWDMIGRTETQARERAFAREDAALFLLSERLPARDAVSEEVNLPQVVTAEGLAQDWHAFVEQYAELLA